MPSELFVDSDEENGFDSGGDDDIDSEDDSDIGDDQGITDPSKTGDGEEADGSSSKKKRKAKDSKRAVKNRKKLKKLGPKQPKGSRAAVETLTKEEIKELTAKEYAHYSNLYNVQIEEVLRETAISDSRKQEVLSWFHEFKSFVTSLPKSKAVTPQEFGRLLKPIKLPLPDNIVPESKGTAGIHWRAPTAVEIRGSWATDTALNKVSPVDIFLEMPYDYLVKSDTLNHRYHLKRAFFLGFLAKKLRQRGDDVKFTSANGECLKPVLSLRVNKTTVLVHAVPPKDYFSPQKLTCERNNLRYDHFFKTAKPEDEPDSSTQHYNFTILQDALANEIHDELSNFLKDRPIYQNAIKLLKIWLTQRELLKGYASFSGFIVSQFLRHLHKTGKINESMTVFQLVRVFFVSLIQLNLCEGGISFSTNQEAQKSAHMQWDVVFLDLTGVLNYTANLSKYTYRRMQQEARRALTIIDGANVTGFLALFVTPVKFIMNFDHVICLSRIENLETHFRKQMEDKVVVLDHSGYIYPLVISSVGSLIERCLGSRITALDCELPESPEWDVQEKVPRRFTEVIRFGLNINREVSQRLIEKCESESHHDIENFKKFWGDKAELRRFKDGTLLESVTLENLSLSLGKNRICFQMLHFIFRRHLRYTLATEEYIDQQLESLVEGKYLKITSNPTEVQKKKIYIGGKFAKVKEIRAPEETEPVDVDRVTRFISSCFDDFSKILRQLEELPLKIATVQGTSSVLRFSDILPTPPQTYFQCKVLTEIDPKKKAMLLRKSVPISAKPNASLNESTNSEEVMTEGDIPLEMLVAPSKVPKFVDPVGVIIHLETSGKWPDNMEAIERLKCAFLLKIGELLSQKFGLTTQPYARHLDVLKDGVVFRLRITYLRELTILRELQGPDGILRYRDNLQSQRLEKETLILPQLTSTLHSFHLQHEAFGKTCRIAKRWVASQLLLASPLEYNRNLEEPDCRLSEEAVELLVAHLFLNFAPHLNCPSEAHVGFVRFLYFLANTDFRALPIILNFNDKLSTKEVVEVELEFVKVRPTLPSVFISTPFDKRGSVWTRNLSAVVLGRVQLLAKQALAVVEGHFEQTELMEASELKKIFKAGTGQFDVIIKLRAKMNPRTCQNFEKLDKPVTFHQYKRPIEEYIPVVDFDPVQLYLAELRNAFGHLAIFLHDLYGGQFIAVVWKPEFFKTCNLTGTSVKGRQLGKDADAIVANVGGALEAFRIMGDGLVAEVVAQSDRWTFED